MRQPSALTLAALAAVVALAVLMDKLRLDPVALLLARGLAAAADGDEPGVPDLGEDHREAIRDRLQAVGPRLQDHDLRGKPCASRAR